MYLCHTFCLQGSGNVTEEEPERLLEAEIGEDCYKTVFSGRDRTVALMNSQWLWVLVQNLDKIKPLKIPAWIGEGFIKSHPYLRSYWQLMTVRGERIRILQAPVDGPAGSTNWTLCF